MEERMNSKARVLDFGGSGDCALWAMCSIWSSPFAVIAVNCWRFRSREGDVVCLQVSDADNEWGIGRNIGKGPSPYSRD